MIDSVSQIPERIVIALNTRYDVSESGCWLWRGAKVNGGYGVVTIGRRNFMAHRLALALKQGSIPPKSLLACHRCNVPNCINPDHLYLGTQSDNIKQAHDQGRASKNGGGRSTTGLRGVTRNRILNCFSVIIPRGGRQRVVFRSKDFFEACCFRKSFFNQYGV